MIYFPSCKINLGLHVLSRRADGYHELESGMLEIPVCDALEMVVSDEPSFSSSGLAIPGDGNLCTDAYALLREAFGLPAVKMHLRKNIPMGAGLGGGSSDAAFVLKLANELFALELSEEKLESFAAELGSDCAFFIRGGFQLAKGRGEELSPLGSRLNGYYILLINPGTHVSTKEAFGNIRPDDSRQSVAEILEMPVAEWKEKLSNDFEESIFPLYPELRAIKEKLYAQGAVYASMSGSGSSMFGLFDSVPESAQWKEYPFVKVAAL